MADLMQQLLYDTELGVTWKHEVCKSDDKHV